MQSAVTEAAVSATQALCEHVVAENVCILSGGGAIKVHIM